MKQLSVLIGLLCLVLLQDSRINDRREGPLVGWPVFFGTIQEEHDDRC